MEWRAAAWLLLLAAGASAAHVTRRRSVDLTEAWDHAQDARLPREVVPTGYRLQLLPDPGTGRWRGRVWINITCLEGTDTVVLHAHEDLDLAHSDVAVRRSAPSHSAMTISSTKKEPGKQWYVVVLSEKLRKDGNYQLEMSFSGDMGSEDSLGLFRGSYQDHRSKEQRWFAATNMRPTNARRVFPCFDEPAYKVPLELSVGSPTQYSVLANSPVRAIEDMEEQPGWRWHHFQKTPPLSTFSVGFLVSDMEHVVAQQGGEGATEVRVYGRPHFLSQLKEAAALAPKVLGFLQGYLGLDYPAAKLDLVALPHFLASDPADHWGLVLFKESDLVGENSMWHVTQELAVQWVGHYATPHWWNYAQVNKAMANYLVNAFTMQEKNQYLWTQGYYLYYGYSSRYAFPNLGSELENIKTGKCTWLLRMLNYTLTERTFRSGLKKFLEDRQYKTFSQKDVWAALTAQGRRDGTLPEDLDVAEVAQSWLDNERVPVVTVNRNYEDNTADVEQHMFLRERPHDVPDRDKMLWYIPIMYLTPDNLNVSAISPVAWMKKQKEITVADLPGPDQFIIVNPEEIGMFMVNYDMNNWALIADALLGRQLPVPVRVKLLHDAWNLAYAGELNFASALNVTLFLKGERDPRVWDIFFTMIDHVGRQISGTKAELKFEEYCRRLLNSLLNSMDEDTKWSRFGHVTRQTLSRISYQPYISTARDIYRQWMDSADPDAGTPVREKYYCPVFEWGSDDEWEFGLQRVIHFPESRKKSERYYLLKTLAGCPRQPEKVLRLLNITLVEGNGNFSDADVRVILSMLTGSSPGYTTLFKFLVQNWDILKQRYANKPHMWEYLISCSTEAFNTQEGLDMVSELYVARQGEFGSADAIIERSLKTIKEEARWSEENLPTLEAWLEWALAAEDGGRAERGAYPMG
ncbi:aminopeptidase N isoform X2 [Bacillus rossius redtenbacheri]|uniref:aminopeptidase N isoform X2 n=1 Tax=Bacillus rossius redtenbacheri TaxID=93214 RepID=UPI002FDC9AA5